MFKLITGIGGGLITLFLIVGAVIGGWLWPYAINSWLVYFGKTASVVWWQGALIGLVPGLGYACVPLGIITWIVMMFIM